MNSQLADFQKIRSVLKKKKIAVADIFAGDVPPEGRHLALAASMNFEGKIEALRLAFEFELESYWYFDTTHYPEAVLIGAYGDAKIPLTAELLDLINAKPEPGDLRLYESRFLKKRKRSAALVVEQSEAVG